MPFQVISRWLRVVLLGLALALPPVAGGLVVGTAVSITDAEAKSRSSGGYSRSSSSSSRTPSVSSSRSSGGYSRPSVTVPRPAAPSTSAGDRALSRQSSKSALDSYRTGSEADRTPTTSTAPRSGGSSWSVDSGNRPNGFRYQIPQRQYDYYQGRNWAPSPYMYGAPRSFGMWDAVFLWFMLDTLTSPGHASFFHNNQSDPGYQQWRTEAEKLAADNAELRAKLDRLDGELAKQAGQPREPGKIPQDVPADMVRASATEAGGAGWLTWIVIIAGVGVLFWLWRARRRLERGPAPASQSPTTKEQDAVPLFGTLGNYVDRKLSGKAYSPSLFRVGMTVTLDPTPFLLAGDRIKAKPPAGAALQSVESVGTLTAGAATVHRLYVSEDHFLQLHLDANGLPDECRYFSVIDEVHPADAEEWGFWLDKDEGAVGWSDFQTKDGAVYPRLWSPGLTHVAPITLDERLRNLRGERRVSHSAMLYAASTGAVAPAPETEYLLVSVVEDAGEARVVIAAGIDINPASLSLA